MSWNRLSEDGELDNPEIPTRPARPVGHSKTNVPARRGRKLVELDVVRDWIPRLIQDRRETLAVARRLDLVTEGRASRVPLRAGPALGTAHADASRSAGKDDAAGVD